MTLALIDHISLPGDWSKPNEDGFGYGPLAAVVLDGATPLGEGLMPGSSDAAWIARFGARRLMAHLNQGEEAMTALGAGLAETQKAFRALRRHSPVARWQLPCASMMMLTCANAQPNASRPIRATQQDIVETLPLARESARTLEFFWYGDCAALVKEGNAELVVIGETLEKRAAEAERARSLARRKGLSAASALHRPEFLSALRRARNQVNSGSYWLFSPSRRALFHVCRRSITVSDATMVLLASDGFLALASDYRAYDPSGLMRAACQKGLKRLGEELREIESHDQAGDRFPRFKKSDDATALLLRLD